MFINIISDDQRSIIYRPKLRAITGSVTATILLQQILYRYTANGNKPFYKFIEPCKHKAYRGGDSWSEELGFSKREFNTALSKIAFKISSKIDKQDIPTDVFVYYWTNMDRLTYYSINIPHLRKSLNAIYVNDKSAFTKMTKAHLDITKNTTKNTTKNLSFKSKNGSIEFAEEKTRTEQLEDYFKKDQFGKIKFNSLKNDRVIRKKQLTDEEIFDEAHKFFLHYESYAHYVSKDVKSDFIFREFKKWLSRSFVKGSSSDANKTKKSVIKSKQKTNISMNDIMNMAKSM